jgi:protein tyrosine phosphatase (PTP) superfamily phosphohydrolase (DUF442 family)
MRKWKLAVLIVAGACVAATATYVVCSYWRRTGPFASNRARDAALQVAEKRQWAQRLQLPSVPNVHKVCDDLYRGGQPTAEGFRELKKLGIKTVVNLRLLHSDRGEIADTGLEYEHINMEGWEAEDDEAVRFLRIVTDKARMPVFVHCQFGSDRTGTMCAVYRVAVQGWSRQEAIDEMTHGGFGFHEELEGFVKYVAGLDVGAIKRRAGLGQ